MENKYAKKALSGAFVLALVALSVIAFFAVRSQTALPEDAYTIQEDAGGGGLQYVVNEKYNVLTQPDPELFKKPYCQALADSRVINLDDANKVEESHRKLVEVAQVAEGAGDYELSEAIELFLPLRETSIEKGEANLSDEERSMLVENYDTIVNYSGESCGMLYSPQVNPRVEKEIRLDAEKREEELGGAVLSDKYDYSQGLNTEGEQWERLTQEEKLRIFKEAEVISSATAPYAGVELAVDPNLFTEEYCTNFLNLSERLISGGTYEELDEATMVALEGIVETLNISQPGSEKISTYEDYLNVYAQGGRHFYISHSEIFARDINYEKQYQGRLEAADAISQQDCGVSLRVLSIV